MSARRILPPSLLLAGVVAVSAPGPARAETAGASCAPVTMLHLSVVGTVQDTPDLLTATLDGTASSQDPAAAQRKLDQAMKAATDLAAGSRTVTWQIAGYAVDQTGPASGTGRVTWSAHQTLSLQSPDADALLTLVGRLQAAGLTVQSLQWQLSPARRLAAEKRASAEALTLLRDRARDAAASLGLHVDSIRSVSLDQAGGIRPMPMMRMQAMAMPQASRTDAEVSQEASGEIALKP